MSQSENALETHSGSSYCGYFNAPASNYNRFASDYNHIYIPESRQQTPGIAKMVSMTKFNGFGIAERWLGILEEELSEDLTPAIWLK